jgi:SAM-dependent methyltransferase
MKDPNISEKQVARYWDDNAEVWARHVRSGFDAFREYFNNPAFLEFIGDLKGKRVLDAGCGEGYTTRILARRGAQVIGIDLSEKMVQLARKEEEREPLGIRYEVGSYTKRSIFDDESFDRVISFMSLMDGPDYVNALREFLRVLKRGGELIYSVTHPCFANHDAEWVMDELGNAKRLLLFDYFDTTPRVDDWKFSKSPEKDRVEPFNVPFFPRILSDYINPLVRSGLVLTEIEEPRPTEEACKKYNWLKKWRDHASLFLYVKALKP